MTEHPAFGNWWEAIGRGYSHQVSGRELCAAAFAAGMREGKKLRIVKAERPPIVWQPDSE